MRGVISLFLGRLPVRCLMLQRNTVSQRVRCRVCCRRYGGIGLVRGAWALFLLLDDACWSRMLEVVRMLLTLVCRVRMMTKL